MSEQLKRGRPPRFKQSEEFEIRRFREAGASIERLAAMWKCSRETIYKVLARQRERLGPERLPASIGRRARAHLYMSKHSPRTSTEH